MTELLDSIKTEVAARGLELGPCLPESAICEFEEKYGVTLPEGYRNFLLHVGNGGLGPPEYGLVPLGHGIANGSPWDDSGDYLSRLREAFPLTEPVIWDDELNIANEDPFTEATKGVLPLGDDGCGMYWVLVISGEARSQVWQIAEEGAQPCAPALDFLNWYKRWLDGDTDWWAGYEA